MEALQPFSCDVDEHTEFHALSDLGVYDGAGNVVTDIVTPPKHPVRSLQGAFEESYHEVLLKSLALTTTHTTPRCAEDSFWKPSAMRTAG